MKRANLFKLFAQARQLTGHADYVIVGSLCILGTQDEPELPAEMSISIDVDSYTKVDPGRILDLQEALGEGSEFHRAHGFFLDPVSPSLPSLPQGWEQRMNTLEQDGVRLWFLDPDDAAISKYARSQPNDLRWIRAGLLSGLISLPKVMARMPATRFLDDEEAGRVQRQVADDHHWFESVKRGRQGARGHKKTS